MTPSELKVALPSGLSLDEARVLLATKLYEVGKVSLGQAAEIASLSKRAFMDVLGRQGVPVVDYPPEELRKETDR